MTDQVAAIIERMVVETYQASSRFNGTPYATIAAGLDLDDKELENSLADLIREGRLSLTFGDVHPNPHIQAFAPHDVRMQIKLLRTPAAARACAYPTSKTLRTTVMREEFDGRPFSLRLALGEPQFVFEFFDLIVLESYRNDPRYYYTNDDISGTISISDRYVDVAEMDEHNKVFIQSFGFGYDESFRRAVAVALWDLHGLTPEHQAIWNARRVQGDFRLHPAYDAEVRGVWADRYTVFDAIGAEMQAINEIAALMNKHPLFRRPLDDHPVRPREISFLVRPTLKEFDGFVESLDKYLSQNIALEFFQGEVASRRPDGKDKGTLQLLDEWLRKFFRPRDQAVFDEIVKPIREVRKLRQGPAHGIEPDRFDQAYLVQQREIAEKVYRALRTLRLLLRLHPKAKTHTVADWLQQPTFYRY